MSTDEDYCGYSDLRHGECAHCAGIAPFEIVPELRMAGHQGRRGRRVWPPVKAEPDERGDDAVKLPGTWAPNADAGECRCGKPTRDQAFVCDGCIGLLDSALGDVTWLTEQLDIAITKQRASASGGGARAVETPLPWHERASEAKGALRAQLVSWVRFCDEERVRGGNAGLPADTEHAMALWLLERTKGLALHDIGPECVDEITDSVAECRRIVFYKRRTRVYLGPCEGCEVDEEIEPCPGEVYAEEHADVGTCDECDRGYTVVIKRGNLERELDDRLCTPAEIARLATFLGLDIPRERVRRQIHSWHKRKQITPGSHADNGDPMFRYGSVKALLYSTYRDTA